MMLHLWYVIDRWIKDPGCQLTKTEKADMEQATALIWGVAERLFKRLDKEYCRKIVRDLEQTKVVTERDTQIYDEINVVKRKSTDVLGEFAIMICNNQIREACIKFKKCPMYNALVDAGVEKCCLETNACPYRGESYNKKTKTWTQVVEVPEIERNYKQAVCESCGQVWNAEDEEQWTVIECPDCGGKLSEWR